MDRACGRRADGRTALEQARGGPGQGWCSAHRRFIEVGMAV